MTVRAFQVPALVAALVAAGSAFSQVPVIDSATLTQATQTAQNTAQIMNTNQQILTTVNQTLSPQSPIKSRRAPWLDRFCGLEGLAESRLRVFGHLLCFVFARRESCSDRVQLARVWPRSRGRGLS